MWVRVPPSALLKQGKGNYALGNNIAWLPAGFYPYCLYCRASAQGQGYSQVGDGNMGDGNAFRQLGAKVGIAVFFVDAGKGALAILVAQAANIPQVAILFTGAAAVVGHNWPVFIGFRGGGGRALLLVPC